MDTKISMFATDRCWVQIKSILANLETSTDVVRIVDLVEISSVKNQDARIRRREGDFPLRGYTPRQKPWDLYVDVD